mgnify:CR=1 FL=1
MIKKLIIYGLILAGTFTTGRIYQNGKSTLEKNIAKVENALNNDETRDDILKRLLKPEIIGYGNRVLVDNLEEGLIRNAPNSDIYFQRILVTGVRSGYDISKVQSEAENSEKLTEKSKRNLFHDLVESIKDLGE